MSRKWKRPGDAVQRMTGAKMNDHRNRTLTGDTYANCGDLQTRYLQRRHGLDERTARMIAAFCFGEGR